MKNNILLFLLAAILQGCTQKELCFDHNPHAPKCEIDVRADWLLDWQYTYEGGIDWQSSWDSHDFGIAYNDLRPHKPTGIKVMTYTDGSGASLSVIGEDGGTFFSTPGHHELLFYNNNTEYITFNDLDYSANATASTRGRSRASYLGNPLMPGNGEGNTVNAPDPLFGAYIPDYVAEMSTNAAKIDVTMKPLVFTYLIRYHFDYGLEYVALARGAMAGMAASVFLIDGHTGVEVATILHECEIKPWGIEAAVHSFGIPDFPNPFYTESRARSRFGVNLEVRLRNGKMMDFNWDITEQIITQPRGGVIEVYGAKVSDDDAKEDTGSFDVTIDGWGEWEDIPLDF